MSDEATAEHAAMTDGTVTRVPITEAGMATWEGYLASIPDAGGEGVEAILRQIDAATSAADLDAPWKGGGLKDYIDRPIVVLGVRKMPSDFADGLPYFLIIDGADARTGEALAATTGSIAVVGQLAKAHALGAFPLRVVPRLAKRPTSDGNWPMHLEVLS